MFFKKKEIQVFAPFDGQIVKLENVSDPTFRDKILGDGVAIIPSMNSLFSPIDGTVSSVIETKHAYGITYKEDIDLLIHIGIDTVNLKGEFFTSNVKEGDNVNLSTQLGSFVKEEIIKKGYQMVTPILLINNDSYEVCNITLEKEVKKGDVIFMIKKK